MRVPVVLGLDVGTTSAKAVAYDADGGRHGSGDHGYELLEPAPGAVELDPKAVVDAAMAALRDAAAQATAAGAGVAGIGVSTAMHAVVALDADGAPLTNLLTWADRRAADEAEELRERHPELHGRTGTPLHPMAPLPKLRWFHAHAPEVVERACRWGGVKELLLERLTGRFAVDLSVASGTGLLDLRAGAWDPEALELAGVEAGELGELVATTERMELTGDAARDTGLQAGLPVVAGAGDGPLANLGLGAILPGVAACSIGTSGALRLCVEEPVTDEQGRIFCYGLVPGRWIVGGAINNGGSVLQWIAETLAPDLGDDAIERLLDEAAAVPPGSDALIMLPYLLSERAPHWSVLPRGAYVGLTHDHHRGHLARAALEGVCQQLALVLASMRDAGNEVREVRATGGFARSPLWRQMLADALGTPVGFARGFEGSSFGAALLGMTALELVDGLERAAELVHIDEVLEPDPEAMAVYDELMPTFAGLYGALLPAFRTLRKLRHAGQEP
jgi:gluconokinase